MERLDFFGSPVAVGDTVAYPMIGRGRTREIAVGIVSEIGVDGYLHFARQSEYDWERTSVMVRPEEPLFRRPDTVTTPPEAPKKRPKLTA